MARSMETAAGSPWNEYVAQEKLRDELLAARVRKRLAIYELAGPNELRKAVLKKMCKTGLEKREAMERLLCPIPEMLWPGLFNK